MRLTVRRVAPWCFTIAPWRPHLSVVNMDSEYSSELMLRLGALNNMRQSRTPVLGLTRRGDLKTKLKAFDLGVDDILTVPFSPEELLARSIVIGRRASGLELPIVPTIRLGEIELAMVVTTQDPSGRCGSYAGERDDRMGRLRASLSLVDTGDRRPQR
jgi:CheY-like chemotaxis protein